MLVEFSVQNYLSFQSRVTLSLRAAPLGEVGLDKTFLAAPGLRLLKSAVLYGANASGKSNLIKALRFVKEFTINSSKERQANEKIPVRRFALSTATEKQPSEFEVVFLHEQVRYRYGFSLDEEQIHREWLLRAGAEQGTEEELFQRDQAGIQVRGGFQEGVGLERRTRPNALFLSLVAQLNGEVAGKVLKWFAEGLRLISGLEDQETLDFTLKMMGAGEAKEPILALVQQADLGIMDLQLETSKPSYTSRKSTTLKTLHQRYNAAQHPVEQILFDLRDESEGTQKFVALSAPILTALARNEVLIVDEFDARLHPLMTRRILGTFNSSAHGSTAQLIVATHDANLLDRRILRKDQVWFTEKDRYGASTLYSLAEFQLDENANFERDYIRGKYGAIPLIGELWKRGE